MLYMRKYKMVRAFLKESHINCLFSKFFLSSDNIGGNNEFEACWERCFQRTDESTSMRHYRLAYAGLYDMGMEARRLKNLRSVNGTTLMLDSTLSDYHDISKNPNLQAEDTVRL